MNLSIVEWLLTGGILVLVSLVVTSARQNDSRVNRVYERLDDLKVNIEDKYTRKDVCQILHVQIDKRLADIQSDVKLILNKLGTER